MVVSKFALAISFTRGRCLLFGIVLGFGAAATTAWYHYYCRQAVTAQRPMNEALFTSRRSVCCASAPASDDAAQCSNAYCMRRVERRVLALMDGAQHSIAVCVYFFTYKRFADALLAAVARGVRVRVIGDQSMAYSRSSQILRLTQMHIPVRFPTDTLGLVHHKFCLIDAAAGNATANGGSPGRWRPALNGILLCGSMNWTVQAMSGNWENLFVTNDPQLVRQFANEFEVMWLDFEKPIKPIMLSSA